MANVFPVGSDINTPESSRSSNGTTIPGKTLNNSFNKLSGERKDRPISVS